ncbi:hypothetical protein RFI_32909 [Reticulomyxa filosa]|uniref:Uncharacterized protein n=1 Tax=Reticulomyxa filosa TaxID=46433 RepID=X6LRJ2_RETFI|nr:hypothetical protein RFI_32909 [Reticulomyxa filosa]|eukprot:ETO04488.1 hypothetical protein RFI_32909 [Reticulomyxa filosa]
MICLFILIKLECILQKDTQEIKAMLLEEIKNYHMFIRQIPDCIINFSVSPINIAISAEFSRYNPGPLFQNDHFSTQYQSSVAARENLFLCQKQKMLSYSKPTAAMLQEYKYNIFLSYNVDQWEKCFSAISEFPQLLVNFGENPGVISKKQLDLSIVSSVRVTYLLPENKMFGFSSKTNDVMIQYSPANVLLITILKMEITIFLKQVAPDDQRIQVALNEQHHQVALIINTIHSI